MRIPSASSDRYVYFVGVDQTDLKTRETGLATWTVYRSRNGGAAAVYTTPTINETDTTNMPGVYELLIDEDTTLDAGHDTEEYVVHITHAGMAPVTRVLELYRPKMTEGQTATVANGAVDADIERLQGSAIATPTTAGVLEVDVTHWRGTAAPAEHTSGYPIVTIKDGTGTGEINTNAGAVALVDLVTTTATATNVTTVNGLAANVITAASMAADASAEIADAVWDEDATGHQTQGTFGQAIGDPAADTNTIYKAVVTDATGATVGVDAAAILADTGTDGVIVASLAAGSITAAVIATGAVDADAIAADAVTEIQSGLATAAALATVDGIVDDILLDTAEIGAAGAGLTAVPWNASWDAEVQSEVEDAIVVHRLDELLNADSDIDGAAPPTVGSVFHELLTKTAGSFTYDQTTDSLEAVRDRGDAAWVTATGFATQASVDTIDGIVDAILLDTAEIGAAGAGLTVLATQASVNTIDDFLDTEIAAIKTQTDKFVFTVANQVDANVQYVNDVQVTGDGQTGTEWGPA